MKIIVRINIIFIVFLVCQSAIAQDFQFSQVYGIPFHTNPAFTGAQVCSRLSIQHRDQWPSVPGKFVSSSGAIDHSVPRWHSGFGLLFNTEKNGSSALGGNNLHLLYAYETQIAHNLYARFGIQSAICWRGLDYFSLYFPDQLMRGGNSVSSAITPQMVNKTSYLDFGSGLLLYRDKYWLGFAAHHLNRPNQSLIGQESILPIKYSVMAGSKFATGGRKSKNNLSPTIYYKHQGKFDQLDLGIYTTRYPLIFGIWYRGLPLIKQIGKNINHDAVIFVVGLEKDKLHIGYSYDLTISRLALSTGGSHEITASYQLCDYKQLKKTKKNVLECPKF